MEYRTEQDGCSGKECLPGHYERVAVMCYFTATGRTMPSWVKFEDEKGVRHMLRDISVEKYDRRQHTGILCQRYECRAEWDGKQLHFSLLFHPGENRWSLIFRR